jgi:hypothetical protein
MSAVRVPVLMYHRVGDAHNDWEHKYCVSVKGFAKNMHALDRAVLRVWASLGVPKRTDPHA